MNPRDEVCEIDQRWNDFPLSLRERAGVRGKERLKLNGTLDVGCWMLILKNSNPRSLIGNLKIFPYNITQIWPPLPKP